MNCTDEFGQRGKKFSTVHPRRLIGGVYVDKDPQKRYGPETFVVFTEGDGTLLGDTVQHGLFWKQEDAEAFARILRARAINEEMEQSAQVSAKDEKS